MPGGSPSTDQPLSKRERNRIAKRKYYAKNRDLIIAKSREYEAFKRKPRKVNKQERTNRNLQWNYGITSDDYQVIFESQGGCCSICLTHQSSFKRRLSVDHDHVSGKVRGLLCIKCNTVLGQSRDDINILKAAISYLEKHRGE
jgi:hypothetical protein